MELLLVPENPAFPVSKTPFVEWDRWDCGPFLSFATRKELLHRVPLHLRHPNPTLHIPYTEVARPSPARDAAGFYIAWLYFGLIAEFLGLNEGPGRSDLGISEEEALRRLVGLYNDIVVFDASDGRHFINGTEVYRHLVPQIKALSSAPEDQCLNRYSHLLQCLDFASHLINSNQTNFEGSIFIAIAALGEILTLTGEVFYKKLSVERQKASLPAPSDTLKPGGYIWALKDHISKAYLESGPVPTTWCPSELEKVREAYTNVSIVHYLSRLDRGSAAGKDHSSCTRTLCQATQIDLANYKLSHTEDGCQCAEFEVNIDEVQSILRASSSFPILLIERFEDASVRLVVEAYKPGDKYVALSHVCLHIAVSYIKAFNNPHASLGLGRWARKSKGKRNPDLSTRSIVNSHH
jgi:hypothetical protein